MECDDESSDFYIMRNGPSVEMIKASETFYTARVVEHCHDCQPLFMDLDPENYESKEQCQCSLFDHFVAKWRCIPCVLAEQTKSVVSRPKPGSTYLWDVGRANFVERVGGLENSIVYDSDLLINACRECSVAVESESLTKASGLADTVALLHCLKTANSIGVSTSTVSTHNLGLLWTTAAKILS